MKSTFRQRNGMALVIGLICVVIATILVVGFTVSMRLERQASGAMANNGRAEIIAQNAIEHAITLLDNNIPQPLPPGAPFVPTDSGYRPPTNWIVNPGLLTKFNGTAPVEIPLSTNMGDPAVAPTTDFVNLNASPSGSADYPIIPTGEPVNASWVYVIQDPTQPASATNPAVGRYAFWMDDENARINVNTAQGKPATLNMNRSNPLDQTTDNGNKWLGNNTFKDDVGFNSLIGTKTTIVGSNGQFDIYSAYDPGGADYPASNQNANVVGTQPSSSLDCRRYYPLWHPSAVNLDILPASLSSSSPIGASMDKNALADWVFNKTVNATPSSDAVQNWRLLKTPEQIKSFVIGSTTEVDAFYDANKFNLTVCSRAPEFNAYGKPRLFMEERINSKATSAPGYVDTNNRGYENGGNISSHNASGTELAFYQTPDIDPLGPMYFHGFENTVPASGSFYTDLTSVQMVGDYLSQMLARNDWPGMPARSFVKKWGGDDTTLSPSDDPGRREADQVAWNIVAMGNYAPGIEFAFSLPNSYWAAINMLSGRNTAVPLADDAGNRNPYRDQLTNRDMSATYESKPDPNLVLRVGKLSGKAILPYSPRPLVNEAVLVVDAVPVDKDDPSKGFCLKVSMQLELYTSKRGPVGSFRVNDSIPNFALTHFFYTVSNATDPTGANIPTFTQGGTGSPSSGPGSEGYPAATCKGQNYNGANSPFVKVLAGKFPLPKDSGASIPPDVHLPVDSYVSVISTSPGKDTQTTNPDGTPKINKGPQGQAFYIAQGVNIQNELSVPVNSTISPPPDSAQKFSQTSIVNIQAKARIAVFRGDGRPERTYQLIPVWDNVDTNKKALEPPTGQESSISWDFSIDLSAVPSTGGTFTRSLEIADPRLVGNTHDHSGKALWTAHPTPTAKTLIADSMGGPNTETFDADSYAYFDFQATGMSKGFYKNSPRPSIGFLSCIPTGMQRGIVNATLKFGPSGSSSELPDWLLLDLVAPIFPDLSQPSVAPYSYLHSTMGKININAKIYPSLGLDRTLPLKALFKHAVPDDKLDALVENIVNNKLSAKGQDFGAPGKYDYIGELCEVEGVADGVNTPGGTTGTDWQKMALIRNLANLITTQSNTFRVWGTAQAIRLTKKAGNTDYGIYEAGDTVTVNGEKRFESTIERSVWPGVDGVPGNGHVGSSGTYDENSNDNGLANPIPNPQPWAAIAISGAADPVGRLPGTAARWARFDGPDNPVALRANYPPTPGWYSLWYPLPATKLKDALNPIRAHMTYKPVMFRYISE
ncbi:MAG TPA: hypothetical protein VIU12_04530 [Chryseolinea sp.]